MSSKRAKAKKKKAAELARKKAVSAESKSTPVAEEKAQKETPAIQETKPVEPVVAEPEKQEEPVKETVVTEPVSVSVPVGETIVQEKQPDVHKKKNRCGLYLSAAVGAALLIAVIVLVVRLGTVTKELKAIQAVSLGYQTELADVKKELDDAELELFSKEPEIVYVEVYPTATPEPTPVPTATPELKKYLVCVDAGHGDWDSGARIDGKNYQAIREEKNDNLWMAKLYRDALMEYEEIEVVMTRETDVFLELVERTDIANEAEADALISFHRNSYSGEADVSGVEFWIHSSRPKGAQDLAGDLLSAIMKVGGMENRGVKYGSMSSFREDYAINRRASMTSMIIELGFITSEKDNTAYDTNGEAYAKEMAKATYEWLVNQKGAK